MDPAPLPSGNSALNGNIPHGQAGNVEAATAEFRKKIDESKLRMQAESQPAKRGPGRPKKVSGEPAPKVHAENPPPSVAKTAPAAPDVTQYLIAPIAMVSKIPASHYGIPELAFTPDEAHICAISCNHLLQVFIPDVGRMSPKSAAIISAFSTFGAIGFSKYQIYLSKIKEKPPIEKPPEETTAAPPISAFEVLAVDHYRKIKE